MWPISDVISLYGVTLSYYFGTTNMLYGIIVSLLNYSSSMFVGFHVDDSEVTLNVCLGKQFTGGELFFRGVRCDRHVNSPTQPEVS